MFSCSKSLPAPISSIYQHQLWVRIRRTHQNAGLHQTFRFLFSRRQYSFADKYIWLAFKTSYFLYQLRRGNLFYVWHHWKKLIRIIQLFKGFSRRFANSWKPSENWGELVLYIKHELLKNILVSPCRLNSAILSSTSPTRKAMSWNSIQMYLKASWRTYRN